MNRTKLLERISIEPDIRFGKPCIRGAICKSPSCTLHLR
uniref:Uncharacterized protein n=1 Tax=Candidatus Kentrum sp. DK TaxID=2126562 RepID=A0A450S8T2_9GAMM|nr:MAG: hypothetical protein BECKDK2373C_GA0170839_102125 [Candidatus Kentron sp. DK]